MITVKKLQKAYDNHIVLNIPDLNIPVSQSLGVVGNNGAGKTTLFRIILDLIKADSGEVISGDEPVALSDHWKTYTGSYLDEGFLIPFLTPIEYFHFVTKLSGFSKEKLDEALIPFEAFLSIDLSEKKKYIRDLSKGNQNKVGIVAAMLTKPKVLILDEPFANLDPSSQIRLKKILTDLRNERSTTLLVSSHDLSYLYEVAERIVILENGVLKNDLQTDNTSLKELESYFAFDES